MSALADGNIEQKRVVIFGCGYVGGAGARQALESGHRRNAPQAVASVAAVVPAPSAIPAERTEAEKAVIARVKSELRDIASMLAAPAARAARPKVVRVRQESDSLFPM